MSTTMLRNIAIVAGVLLFVPALVISPALAVVLAIIAIGAGYVAMQIMGKSQVRMKNFEGTDLLEKMWIPVRDELSQVVRMGGRITAASSVWSGVPNLYKQESPATFHQEMERYVNKRAQVAPMIASATSTEGERRQQEIEQQKLLVISRELLEETRKAIASIPGSETVVRRAAASQLTSHAQQAKSAATRPSAASGVGTRQPSSVSRSSQAQTATPSRTIRPRPTPPRPSPAPAPTRVRTPRAPRPSATPSGIMDTPSSPEPVVPSPPSRPSPTPLRTMDTSAPPEPAVAPPAPRVPEPPPPPSVPPAPSAVPEPAEPIKPPEPVVVTPTASEPEPPTTPSAPTGDTPLDVESVCEDLFNPNMMSYQTNRLFDDRYKDAMVRWKGTARRASAYSYDFNFGDGGGTKAEMDVYEVKQQYGSRTVKAVVQLPVEAADDLGARIGEDIEFEGRLITCEGSARRLYVADAHLLG